MRNTGDNGGIDPLPNAGTGTLRQAIIDANADPMPANIEFDIPAETAPGSGIAVPGFYPDTQTWRITLDSALPTITNTVWIDASSQAHAGVPYSYPGATVNPVYIVSKPNSLNARDGNNAQNRVILDGHLTGGATGFVLDASHSILRGFIITGFGIGVTVPALDIKGNPVVGNLIQGNDIGDYFVYPVDTTTGKPLPSPNSVGYMFGQGIRSRALS